MTAPAIDRPTSSPEDARRSVFGDAFVAPARPAEAAEAAESAQAAPEEDDRATEQPAAADEATSAEPMTADEALSGEPAADEPAAAEPAAADEPAAGEPAAADEPAAAEPAPDPMNWPPVPTDFPPAQATAPQARREKAPDPLAWPPIPSDLLRVPDFEAHPDQGSRQPSVWSQPTESVSQEAPTIDAVPTAGSADSSDEAAPARQFDAAPARQVDALAAAQFDAAPVLEGNPLPEFQAMVPELHDSVTPTAEATALAASPEVASESIPWALPATADDGTADDGAADHDPADAEPAAAQAAPAPDASAAPASEAWPAFDAVPEVAPAGDQRGAVFARFAAGAVAPADQPRVSTMPRAEDAMADSVASARDADDGGDLWFLSGQPRESAATAVAEQAPDAEPSSAATLIMIVLAGLGVIALVILFLALFTSIIR